MDQESSTAESKPKRELDSTPSTSPLAKKAKTEDTKKSSFSSLLKMVSVTKSGIPSRQDAVSSSPGAEASSAESSSQVSDESKNGKVNDAAKKGMNSN